ncbi:hypothetical protein B0H14DRAFT_2198429, partial [Mycena olivaceomarginata]
RSILLEVEMGVDWKDVVSLWWTLEELWKFATWTKSHATTHRLKAVGVWVKNARKGNPDIGSASGMEREWWAWWKSINPGWRMRDGELLREGDGGWDVLRCPGQNGFLNIIVCLKWWRSSMETPSDAWMCAVADVKWVLGKM